MPDAVTVRFPPPVRSSSAVQLRTRPQPRFAMHASVRSAIRDQRVTDEANHASPVLAARASTAVAALVWQASSSASYCGASAADTGGAEPHPGKSRQVRSRAGVRGRADMVRRMVLMLRARPMLSSGTA